MIKPFADQLDALLANARSYADEVSEDLAQQLQITASIERAASHIREANLRAMQNLLSIADDEPLAPEEQRARELSKQIAEQWQ